jgi:hypothetical protein
MRTKSLDVVLSNPGVWIICGCGHVMLVEVAADGSCHQLDPDTFERDGELRPGGWEIANIVTMIGPLQR